MKSIEPLFLALALAFLPALAAPGAEAAAESKPPHSYGRESALADVKKLSIGAGLEARLFACEPDVVNPADMDVDARGRVWIAKVQLPIHLSEMGILRPCAMNRYPRGHQPRWLSGQANRLLPDPTVNTGWAFVCWAANIRVAVAMVFVLTDTDGDDSEQTRAVF